MAVWQLDLDLVPTTVLNGDDVMRELSSFLPKTASWSESVLIWGDIDGNCVQLIDDGSPPELLLRFDLRIPSVQFIRDLVSFANRMHYQFVKSDGMAIPSTVSDIGAVIATSDAFRFVSSPREFLDSLK